MFWFTSVSNGTLGMLGSHRRPLSAPVDLSDRGNPDMKAARPRIFLPQRPFCGSLAPRSSGDGHRLGISEPFPSFPVPSQITAENKAAEPGVQVCKSEDYVLIFNFKGIVHPKMKFCWKCTCSCKFSLSFFLPFFLSFFLSRKSCTRPITMIHESTINLTKGNIRKYCTICRIKKKYI